MRSEWTSAARRSSPGSSPATGASSAVTSARPRRTRRSTSSPSSRPRSPSCSTSRWRAVGFGAPSPIDQESGVVVRCVNVPLEDAPLRDRMHERFGLPVGLDNDANAAAIGEWRAGAGRGRGRPRHAHARDRRRRRGHLRRQALPRPERRRRRARSRRDRPRRPAVPGRVHRSRPPRGVRERERGDGGRARGVRARRPTRTGSSGSRTRATRRRRSCSRRSAGYLGSGIGSFVNVFAPQLVVLGGGFGVAAFDYLRGPAEEVARREALEPMRSTRAAGEGRARHGRRPDRRRLRRLRGARLRA